MPKKIQALSTALEAIAVQEEQIATLEQEVATLKAFIQQQNDALDQVLTLINQTSVNLDGEGGDVP